MTVPPRVRTVLGALSMLLLFGLLGFAWWLWRHRPGSDPPARFRRVRSTLVVVGMVIIAIGSLWRLTPLFMSVPSCTPPGGAQAPARISTFDASLASQQAATWPETGIGLLYSRARGARVCLSRSADYLVAVHADNIAGTKAMTLGDIVLTPGFHMSREQLKTLIGHEARHRAQWAVGTAIGGPFAFPVAYAIDDFFFPGSRNHFERQAGLETGGYRHVGTGPVLGPAQIATLTALAAIIVVALLRARHRRLARRSSSADEQAASSEPKTAR